MSPGLLPFLLWTYPHRDPLSPTLRWIIAGIVLALALAIFAGYRAIARRGERGQRLTSVAGYAASVLVMMLLFPGQLELAMTVLAVLAFGDGSATLMGKLIGGPRLPWNLEKSWSGLCSFVVLGGTMASIVYWGETHFNAEALGPPVPFPTAVLIGFGTAAMAAVYESLPWRINDNIRVGTSAALTVAALHGLLVGFW